MKENVWRVESGTKKKSLKRYDSYYLFQKVVDIHQSLSEINFPHILPLSSDFTSLEIMQPWVQTNSVHQFESSVIRKRAWNALKKLHNTNRVIDWQNVGNIPPFDLIKKWSYRIDQFHKYQDFIEHYLGKKLFQLIASSASTFTEKLTPFSTDSNTLLHGDIVHHNFIFAEKETYLIDFDLACLGNEKQEEILLFHRFLPYMNYHLPQLIYEFPEAEELVDYLKIPNEIMREWIYAAKLPESQLPIAIPRLRAFTQKAMPQFQNLWYN
ncbi:phosphotransferase [Paenisporosarcina cavernae]|uniref:phosphotransferase n=1 Tax=Paenisporosarcina cavernae TaxID=2320858 RepID=UPI0013C475AD|nr:phosphotransferase [Paenisporosarcina cavernae]